MQSLIDGYFLISNSANEFPKLPVPCLLINNKDDVILYMGFMRDTNDIIVKYKDIHGEQIESAKSLFKSVVGGCQMTASPIEISNYTDYHKLIAKYPEYFV